jgi:glucose-1-phosphate cytidylyltransferase
MEYISGDETVWEKDTVEQLAKQGHMGGYRHYGFWSCMDTMREKDFLEELWRSGKAPWKIWE